MEEHKHEEHTSDDHPHHEVHHEDETIHKVREAHQPIQRQHTTAHKVKKPEHAVKKAPAHHPPTPPKIKRNYFPYIAAAAIIIVIIALIIRFSSSPATPPVKVENPSQYGTSKVDFYVMSQCPYGTQVEDAIQPVIDELADNVQFNLNFIAAQQGTNFQSLHGPAEVVGDKIHLCFQKYYPKQLIDFVACQNKDVQDFEGTIDKCAQAVNVDPSKITTCYKGDESTQLLIASIKKSNDIGAQGSPTIYINDQAYSGGRDASSFKRSICTGLKNHPACAGIPACSADTDCKPKAGQVGLCQNPGKKDASCTYQDDAKVEMQVVSSKDCTTCDTTQLRTVLSQIFLNMDISDVDASSTAGTALVKKFSLEMAPSYIFTSSLADTYAWKNNPRIQGAFKKVGDYYVLIDEASGSSYVLDPAKRKQIEEKVGVKKGDNRPQIDYYVMAYCPYGNQAEEAIEPVYQLLKGKADFNPHYVIYSNYAGGGSDYCLDKEAKYCSMHGIQELNQDVRELCVNKYMGIDTYFKFVLAMNKGCSAGNADSCWEKVATGLKLDVAKIKTCQANEAVALLANEVELNKLLKVSGSPTIFVEGQPYSGSRDAAGYAQGLCASFDTAPDACSAESLASLGSAAPATASAGAGCGS